MKKVFDSVSRGLFFVFLGIIFFLINFGILSWSFWTSVIDLWPLLLILIGIGLLFNKRFPFSAFLLVFLIALVGYSLIFGDRYVPFGSTPYHYSQSQQMVMGNTIPTDVPLPPGVNKAQLKINLGGAQVNVGALGSVDDSQLAKGSYVWENLFGSNQPQFETKQTGDTMNVSLTSTKKGGAKDFLNMDLSTKVKYSLDMNAGAIDGNLDLSQLKVESFNLNTGASKFELRFGDTGVTTQGKISSGASKVTLVVPENVGLRVHFSGVASNTNFMGSGILLDNKNWESPGFEQAKSKVDLTISSAAGSIDLVQPQESLN